MSADLIHRLKYNLPVNPMNMTEEIVLDGLIWLNENDGVFSSDVIDTAARKGCLNIIKWLHENRNDGCTTNAMDYAATNGHIEIVKWLHENRTEGCTTDAMDGAIVNGYLEVVQWLYENRTEGYTERAIDFITRRGHLEIVNWLKAAEAADAEAPAPEE